MSSAWVVFDAMGVIFEVGDDTNELLIPFIRSRNPDVSSECIRESYISASAGQITAAAFWDAVGLGGNYPDIETEYLDVCQRIDRGFCRVANLLRRQYKLGYLSNDLSEWSAFLREKFGLDEYFELIVVSAEVGHRKPSREIYEIAIRRTGLEASRSVFVDDTPVNLRAASQVGMKTIHFQRRASNGDFRPDATVSDFGQLAKAIRRIERDRAR